MCIIMESKWQTGVTKLSLSVKKTDCVFKTGIKLCILYACVCMYVAINVILCNGMVIIINAA